MSVALRILFVFAVSLTQSVAADDWPNWRGPHHDGISCESNWTPKGIEQPVWKASIGLGYSCVAISDRRLFTMGYDQEESVDVVSCLDAASGKELWRQSYPAQRWNKYHSGGTNSTPVVNGDRVYTINREGKFHCFDSKTGKIIWSKDVHGDFDVRLPTWGFSVSPLVVNDRIILNVDRVLAFHAQSGELLWKTTPYGSGYSTPVPFDELGEPGVAVMNGLGLVVIRSKDGSEIAQYEWKTQEDVNAATPVVVGNRLFISSGYDHGAALIEFTSDGAKAVWETKKMRNKMATSILWNDHLYGFDESVLKCMDLNGNEKWRKPRLGTAAALKQNWQKPTVWVASTPLGIAYSRRHYRFGS